MDTVKIYGLCLERLKYQLRNAMNKTSLHNRMLLECYNTGDPDDIIDILELYDIEERTIESVINKLADLAYTVSALTCETLSFDFTEKGYLGLYLELKKEYADTPEETIHGNRAEFINA